MEDRINTGGIMKLKSSCHNVVIVTVLLSMLLASTGFAASDAAEKKSWKQDTALVSQQGTQTIVCALEGDKILFKNADPQLAIEWAMANARTTVVLAGQYVVSDVIDIPRDDVMLIIDQGAELSLNRETEHKATTLRPPLSHLVVLIWNRGHDNFRLLIFGRMTKLSRVAGRPGKVGKPGKKDIYGVIFDGRNKQRTCGVRGGLLLTTGIIDQCLWLVDSSEVQVPIMASELGTDGPLVLEGCDYCKLGMIVNLASTPGGKTGETVDLNGRNRGITIDLAIGERPYELIDNNSSYVDVEEIVSVGKPQKLLKFHGPNDGARLTKRRHPGPTALNVKKTTILEDAVNVILKNEVPKLPDALPRFTVKSTVEVTLKDGSKKVYTKEVEIDVRDGGVKPEKKE